MGAFTGLRLGYRLWLEQNGDRVEGHGFKWTENGRVIAPAARTPITVEGTATGARLELRFTEMGTRRMSRGTLALDVADAHVLRGRFSSDAARSSGSVAILREL